MNQKQLISIIIPYYNTPLNYFKEAIESILSQNHENWEAIVVDDCSNEKNKNNLKNYIESLSDKRFILIHLDKNYGPSRARNKGIETSKGEIITLLDSDDLYLPWHIEEVSNQFLKNPSYDVVLSDALFYINFLNITKKIFLYMPLFKLFGLSTTPNDLLKKDEESKIYTCATFSFKRKAFDTISFDPNLHFDEDLDLLLQIAQDGNFTIGINPKPGYIYRKYNSNNRISSNGNFIFQDIEKIINKYKNCQDPYIVEYIENYMQKSNNWKYSGLINNYYKNRSLVKYINDTFLTFKPLKERIESLKSLIRANVNYNGSLPKFSISINQLKTLFSPNVKRHKELKSMFIDYLSSATCQKTSFYAERIYQKIF